MVILHAFLALTAGFAVLALLAVGFSKLVARLTPGWAVEQRRMPAGYAFVSLGSSFLAAAAGGYVTAWIAAANPLIHVLALGIVVLALTALSVLQSRGKQPIWFALALVALSPIGVMTGGLVRLRVLGIL
ncbi:MAG: hypothetical protein ABR906_05235 [Terracidiphilus sp.]|jgi:hypothetical protein